MNKQLTYENLEVLVSQGLSKRQMASQLGVHHNTVASHLKKHGLSTLREKGKPPVYVDENHSICSKCNQVVLNTDFALVASRSDGRRLSYCKRCRYQQGRAALGSNTEAYLRDKQHRLRRNRRSLDFNLPDGYLYRRWEEQGGKCFYTDMQLTPSLTSGRSDWSISIDRIDQSKGYVIGNIAICGNRINSIKRDMTLDEMQEWTPEWFSRASRYLDQTDVL